MRRIESMTDQVRGSLPASVREWPVRTEAPSRPTSASSRPAEGTSDRECGGRPRPPRARGGAPHAPRLLRRAAILSVEGVFQPDPRPFPREVAVQRVTDPGGVRCWLVTSEHRWHLLTAAGSATQPTVGGDGGTAPAAVARELNAALSGQRVYAEHPGAVRIWLRRLFQAAGERQSFDVLDIDGLLDALVRGGGDVVRAQEAIWRLPPPATRAAWTVTTQAGFVRRLAGVVDVGECEDEEVYEVEFLVPPERAPSPGGRRRRPGE